jgi:hypothetical protein
MTVLADKYCHTFVAILYKFHNISYAQDFSRDDQTKRTSCYVFEDTYQCTGTYGLWSGTVK